jgi:hypothetical protein
MRCVTKVLGALCVLCRWDEQNALLVESHERVIKDLTEEAEVKLAVEVLAAQSLRQEKEVLLKEASEVSHAAELVCFCVLQPAPTARLSVAGSHT